MKKLIFVLLAVMIFLPFASAINLDVQKTSSNEVLIADISQPAHFDLEIKNNGSSDSFSFYNLLGFKMFPVGTVLINSGQTKDVKLEIKPIDEFDYRGSYSFDYFIRNSAGEEQKERLSFRVIDLNSAFEIGSASVDPESNSINIYVKNLANYDFKNIDASFSSLFFDFEKKFDIGPYEEKEFTIELDKDRFKQLTAGYYTLNADMNAYGTSADVEGVIQFTEKDLLTTNTKDYGVFINTHIIEKSNNGNVVISSETIVNKNIFSRLFTSMTPEPDFVEREGSKIIYTWVRELNPGDNIKITVTTNWLFPLLLILFVVIIVVLVRLYSVRSLVLRKKVSFVKAKGGEFALKVSIFVQARKYIERVSVIDRLPPLVKLYEKFGIEKPIRADSKLGKLEWNFEKLEQGETRVLSYVVYSKVGVLGKFALPSATGIYEKDGKIKESSSNKAFFVAEQGGKFEED